MKFTPALSSLVISLVSISFTLLTVYFPKIGQNNLYVDKITDAINHIENNHMDDTIKIRITPEI